MSIFPPLVIGWKERIDFPDWKVRRVRVKVDTGARTSALGVVFYDLVDDPEGGRLVRLQLAISRRSSRQVVAVTAPVLGIVVVTNSNGMKEHRPVIETPVRLGPVTKPVRFTVTNRSAMRFPVILGRRALAGDFVVDVTTSYTQKKKR
jgi:hypothetical protein